MSSAKENTVRSSKKVPCYCPRCNRKSVDPKTKRDHINLADIGSTSISEGQSSSKHKHNEEPLSELPKHGNSESKDSKMKIQKEKIQKLKIAMMIALHL